MTSIKIKSYLGKRASFGAQIAIKNRLYIPGWLLLPRLKSISEITDDKIYIAYSDGNIPIGIIFCEKNLLYYAGIEYYEIMIFVRKKYRRQGVGRALIAQVKRSCSRISHDYGIDESVDFFCSMHNEGLINEINF